MVQYYYIIVDYRRICMKKLITLLLCCSIMVSSFAFATSAEDVQPTTNNLAYSQDDEYDIYPIVRRLETNILPDSAVLPDTLSGDVNSDNKFNIKDMTLLQKNIAQLSNTPVDTTVSDLNTDSYIDGRDVTLGQKIIIQACDFSQNYLANMGKLGTNTFSLQDNINIVYGSNIDSYTKDYLVEVLDDYNLNYNVTNEVKPDSTNIILGVKGSGDVADNYINNFDIKTIQTDDLFNQYDAYVLTALKDTIAIVGRDTDATFYGVSTLKKMFTSFAGEHFVSAFIEDYSTIEFRGFIEGMYARWGDEGRKNLMNFARDIKMNTYIYASKTDVYHTSKCAELYPQAEIDKIKELVEIGKSSKCTYGWSFHLSGFFNGLDTSDETAFNEKYNKLIAKLQQLYDVGVRSFSVLNDDFGAGSNEDVVKLINKLNREFLVPNGCDDMIFCPKGYCGQTNQHGLTDAEANAMKQFDDNIMIFWTGDAVNAPMTQSTIDFVAGKTNHSISTWLNYPVNEHDLSGMFLGDITHYTSEGDGITGQRAALSNPCLYPEASKVAIYQLACYWWNNSNYSQYAQEVWENCFMYIQPEVAEAYYKIAQNVSSCTGSSRVTPYKESEYLTQTLASVKQKVLSGADLTADTETLALIKEFSDIYSAVQTMKSDCTNELLLTELEPWLNALADVADAGRSALETILAVQKGDINLAWENLSNSSLKISTSGQYQYLNGSGSSTYVKAAAKRLQPFVNSVITEAKSLLAPYLDIYERTFIGVVNGTDVSLDLQGANVIDGDDTTYALFNKVQNVGDYVGINLGKPTQVNNIRILQGKTDTDHDIIHDGVIEYSLDGEQWTEIKTVTSNYLQEINDLDITAMYVRFRVTNFNNPNNTSKKDYWLHIREFAVNYKEQATTTATMYENNLTKTALRDGAWSNVFDGKLDTYVWTSEGQVTGQFITFDLGQEGPIYDVSMYFSDSVIKPRLYYAKIQLSADNANWTDVYTFNNDLVNDYIMSGEYRVAKFNANGLNARYLRIYITQDGPDNPYIRIQEIEYNKTVSATDSRIQTTLSGDVTNMIDKNISTVFVSDSVTTTGDYIVYTLDNSKISKFNILQNRDTISNADVSIIDLDGAEHNLGKADSSFSSFDVSNYNGVAKIKLLFPENISVKIYEITTKEKSTD